MDTEEKKENSLPSKTAHEVPSSPDQRLPTVIEGQNGKTRKLFQKAVLKKMKTGKINGDLQTRQMINLVRDLSNQDDLIEGQPEVTHILHKLVKFAEERRATHAASQEHFERLNAKFFGPVLS